MVSETKKFTDKQKQLAVFANALAHPVRVAILDLLASQTCCYHGDMAEELPVANSTLSQHLKVLKDAGLIQGEISPPKTKYCINRANYAIAFDMMTEFFNAPLDTTFSEEGVVLCS